MEPIQSTFCQPSVPLLDPLSNLSLNANPLTPSPLQPPTTQVAASSSTTLDLISTGNAGSRLGSISADGRYIAFESGDDVYVRDRTTNTTSLVSVNSSGTEGGNGTSFDPVLSSNGRYVAFTSTANNLVSGILDNPYSTRDVFLRDLLTGTTTLVSINTAGTATGNSDSGSRNNAWALDKGVAISDDGRFVAFSSGANNLVTNDNDALYTWGGDVFVRDLLTGTTTLLSDLSYDAMGGSSHGNPVISADGQSVAFTLHGVGNPNPNTGNLFVANLQTGTTIAANVYSAIAPATAGALPITLSANGRYVAFVSSNSNAPYSSDPLNVYVWDSLTNNTTLVSTNYSGTGGGNAASGQDPANSFQTDISISADGRYVAFTSAASNLVENDTNNAPDVFVRDLQAGTTTLINQLISPTQSPYLNSFVFPNPSARDPTISPDGRYVTFTSGYHGSRYEDVYAWDRVTNSTTLISRTIAGGMSGSSGNSIISRDGSYIAFESRANFLPGDTNTITDIYGSSTNHLLSIQSTGG